LDQNRNATGASVEEELTDMLTQLMRKSHQTGAHVRTFVALAILAGLGKAASNITEPFRGVNLGGWLVLESWIKPSLYTSNGVKAGLGEWGFCETLGKTKCEQVM